MTKNKKAELEAVTKQKTTSDISAKQYAAEESDPVAPKVFAVGGELRKAREGKKVSIEEVSSSLNIKVSQLEAIENNDVKNLPGMTYAIGFVKSYAGYLGLEGREVAARFKEEHSSSVFPANISFSEPLEEGKVPDTVTIGVSAFLAIIFLLGWTVYSNLGFNDPAADTPVTIPSVEEFAKNLEQPSLELLEKVPEVKDNTLTQADNSSAMETATAIVDDVVINNLLDKENVSLSGKIISSDGVVAEDTEGLNKERTVKEKSAEIYFQEESLKETVVKDKPLAIPEKNVAEVKAVAPKIKIERNVSAVVLQATQASWVQVTDKDQNVLFRKVLRPGDKYFVPNKKDLYLVTANAGGLDVFVEGEKVRPLGTSGEIVRGISLNPKALRSAKAGTRP